MPILALRLSFAVMALVVTFLALTPGPAGYLIESGPIRHMLAFAALPVLSSLAWPGVRAWWQFLAFAAFGAAIEFAQLMMDVGRMAEWNDWANDLIATTIALTLVAIWRAWAERGRGLEAR